MTKENEEEFYPMPMFVRLMVRDVAATARWYEDALGFRSVYALRGADGILRMNHIRLGSCQDLMLIAQPEDQEMPAKGQGVVMYMITDIYLDRLADRDRSVGSVVEGPTDTPWNPREFTVTDPEGYVLTLSTVVDRNRRFSEVMPPTAGSERLG